MDKLLKEMKKSGYASCDCDEFKIGMKWIQGCELLAINHGMKYEGSYMRYCAWCGKELILK